MSTALLPAPAELRLDRLVSEPDSITVVVETARESVPCPDCQQPSRRVHSRYTRTLADLPWNGVSVRLRLHTRRFFCSSLTCARRVFTERLPQTAARYARRTARLTDALQRLGLLVGGEPGARLAGKLGMHASGDTLLRRTRQFSPTEQPIPRVLGVDDWAWRRGQRYGTILVDLERRAVVDLLPNREAATLARWLQQHPGVEILSRDRSNAYGEGAANGAPEAVQVADRWHLLKNMTDALERVLQSKHAQVRQAAKLVATEAESAAPEHPTEQPAPVRRLSSAQQQSRDKRDRRLARYEQVVALHEKGVPQAAIGRQLGLGRKTVRRWLRTGQFPERARAKRHSALTRYLPYLEKRWSEGCHNAAKLWREIRAQGYGGCAGMVRQWAGAQRRKLPAALQHGSVQCAPKPAVDSVPTPRQATWLLLQTEELEAKKRAFVDALYQTSPELKQAAEAAREFTRMIRERDGQAWSEWQESAAKTLLAPFANHLRRDEAAVKAALKLPWSNGPTEGQVHRLKLIKRQMYGRAKLDLLKARVLYKAA